MIPLAAGIVAADALLQRGGSPLYLWLFIALAVCGLLLWVLSWARGHKSKSPLFGIGLFLLLAAAGAVVTQLDSRQVATAWPSAKCFYKAVITDQPQLRDDRYFCEARVEAIPDDKQPASAAGKAYLYLDYSYWAGQLKAGDKIVFKGKMMSPRNAGNPYEFNYERYLYIKGVSGRCYLTLHDWCITGRDRCNLRAAALSWRARLLEQYRRWGFGGDNLAVLSALTLGYKGDLSGDVKEDYATAGASHILALSGLHLGILYMIIDFLLSLFWRRQRWGEWVKAVVTITLLWTFAFVVGLAPSVVRAALLFSLFGVARCMGREGSTLNSLAFAAMVMLLYSPRYLFDVSFQLSFAAVFAIVLLQPPLYRMLPIHPRHRLAGYLWGVVTVSLAAQIGTAPLILCYFSNFPLYFLLTNLLIVPLAFVIILLAVVLWASLPVPLLHLPLAWLLNLLISIANGFMARVSSLPLASVEFPRFGAGEALLLYFVIAAVAVWLIKRANGAVSWALGGVAALCLISLLSLFPLRESPYLLFYNNREAPTLQLTVSRERSYLLTTLPDSLPQRLRYIALPCWKGEGLSTPRLLPEIYSDKHIASRWGLASFEGRRICLLNDATWSHCHPPVPLRIDYLWVSSGFKGKLCAVLTAFTPRVVVLDGSLAALRRASLRKECRKLNINFVDLYEKGAWRVKL